MDWSNRVATAQPASGHLPMLFCHPKGFNAPKKLSRAQERLDLIDLGLEAVELQSGVQRSSKLVRHTRLGEVLKNLALVNRIDCRLAIGVARQHHPHHPRVGFSDLSQQLETIHTWHSHVRDDDRVLASEQLAQGIRAAGRGLDLIFAAQLPTERIEDIAFIIDE